MDDGGLFLEMNGELNKAVEASLYFHRRRNEIMKETAFYEKETEVKNARTTPLNAKKVGLEQKTVERNIQSTRCKSEFN
jgi:hypothetical protein